MECRAWIAEIVETARSGAEPEPALQSHLRSCGACAARWTLENNLNVHVDAAREAALLAHRTRLEPATLWRQARTAQSSGISTWTRFALAAAAMLVLTLAVSVARHPAAAPAQSATAAALPAPEFVAALYASGDPASDATAEEAGYVEIPYAPPLAPGESLNVEVTELSPAELAGMGVDWNPADARESLLAEVVTGEDGVPRAVRVLGDMNY
jgi:hypothetical protein